MSNALLDVQNLSVRFEVKRGGLFGKPSYLYAVDDVSFQVEKGQTLGIVGESGSGKTTAALAVARLVNAHDGVATLDGDDILTKDGEENNSACSRISSLGGNVSALASRAPWRRGQS